MVPTSIDAADVGHFHHLRKSSWAGCYNTTCKQAWQMCGPNWRRREWVGEEKVKGVILSQLHLQKENLSTAIPMSKLSMENWHRVWC